MTWIWIGLAAVLLFFVCPMGIVCYAGSRAFGSRFDGYNQIYSASDFPGLSVRERDVPGDCGQPIRVFLYERESVPPKGLLLWLSGIGGDHSSYLPMLDFFAEQGWKVAAYDPTGTGQSGGRRVKGLTQNLLDARSVLDSLREQEELRGLPLCFAGHSNGGYAALALLNFSYPVRAAAVFSAFDSTADMIMFHVGSFAHGLGKLARPYVRLYYRLLFGKEDGLRASDGMKRSGIPVFLVHSGNDDVVPSAELEKLSLVAAPGSEIRRPEGRYHEAMFPAEISARLREKEKASSALLLEGKARTQAEKERRAEIREQYKKDYHALGGELDRELLKEIDRFLTKNSTE